MLKGYETQIANFSLMFQEINLQKITPSRYHRSFNVLPSHHMTETQKSKAHENSKQGLWLQSKSGQFKFKIFRVHKTRGLQQLPYTLSS